VCRKGGKIVTMPFAPRVARAIDLAIGERAADPIFLRADGGRLERHVTRGSCGGSHDEPGSTSGSGPTRSATR
jgi:hypothetical protein